MNRIKLLSLFLLMLLASCTAPEGGLSVTDARVRPSAMPMTAAYLVMHNDGVQADRLLGAESPAARVVEIHQTVLVNDVASMQHIPALDIPAGELVEFKPGGYHLMLIDLQQPLAAGDEIELTLIFENAGRVTLRAAVQD